MTYNSHRHPAFAVGYITVFVCLVIMFIVAITGMIPLALQGSFIITLMITIFLGAAIGFTGYFKSYDRQAYPIMILVIFILPLIFFALWVLTR